MSSEIEWEDPPADGRSNGLDPRWAEMKAHPGKWLVWSRVAKSSNRAQFRSKGYEVVTRRNADRSYTVYVRWPDA